MPYTCPNGRFILDPGGLSVAQETLERRLLLAGLDALRQIGGDALVQVLLTQAGQAAVLEAQGNPDVETRCIAVGDRSCEIQVSLRGVP
jgi:hypothetical protein